MEAQRSRGPLTGIRVIELADEQAEYCGLTLAGLGADVIKIEPPGGNPTRRIGPFYEDREDPERSLFFWQYNRGKRSIVLDLHRPEDRDRFRALVATADVLLESTPRGELDALRARRGRADAAVTRADRRARLSIRGSRPVGRLQGLGPGPPGARGRDDELRLRSRARRHSTICRRSPLRCGTRSTSPASSSRSRSSPRLLYRWRTGKGQQVSCAIHEAVAKSTEVDLMTWVMRRALVMRQTCRHAREGDHAASVHRAHEGRPLGDGEPRDAPGRDARSSSRCSRNTAWTPVSTPRRPPLPTSGRFVPGTGTEHGQARPRHGGRPALRARVHLRERAVARGPGGRHALGAACASRTRTRWIRTGSRAQSCTDVEHPELGRSFRYATSKWLGDRHVAGRWAVARRC